MTDAATCLAAKPQPDDSLNRRVKDWRSVRLRAGVLVLVPGLLAMDLTAQEWKPVPGQIMTRWAAQVDPQAPLPEYPRPQMVRSNWMNLNGLWDYRIETLEEREPETYAGKILVPYPIESALSGLKMPLTKTQRLWYHRRFKAPPLPDGRHLLLHFGAVDWETRVSLNGKPVGEHRGGYDPFSFDITLATRPDQENELVVSVFDPTGSYQPKGKQNFNKIAKPGGIAYTPCSGIWQTVWLESVPATHIATLKMTPDVDAGVLHLCVVPSGSTRSLKCQAVASDAGQQIGRVRGSTDVTLDLAIPHAHLWTPEDPFLYTLKVRLGRDEVTSYFGMRKISIGKDPQGITRTLLNNQFLFQRGPLDQGYWPDGIYTAPTDEALRFDIEEMKKLGFNMVRKHLKVEPDRWYYWCDRLGLLVWQDMPNGDGGKAVNSEHDGVVNSPVAAQEFEAELQAMIQTHYNHPSIILWTIFNEGWGQYDVPRLTQWVRGLDRSRLLNSTSGWHDQQVGDLVDTHRYPGPACPTPESHRAAVLGEYGGLGLGIPGHTWVDTISWGYRSTTSSRHLTRKYLELWRKVWQFKDQPGLCASVYTQLTDVETECNGLLTYDRAVEKVDVAQVFAALHGHLTPPPRLKVILPTGPSAGTAWRYTFEPPTDDWVRSNYDATAWLEGAAGFGQGQIGDGPARTLWKTDDLWLRGRLELPEMKFDDLALNVLHRGNVEIYLNGVLALSILGSNPDYDLMDIRPEALKSLRPGANLMAVHCHHANQEHQLDLGVVQIQEP